MKDLFEHVGAVTDTDIFDVTKIPTGIQGRTNNVVQRNLLLANYLQGTKSFEHWSKEISNAAKLISYEIMTGNKLLLLTLNPELREGALQDNVSYEDLLKSGITKEQSEKGAAVLEKASAQSSSQEQHYAQEVRQLQHENRKLKALPPKKVCGRCEFDKCEQWQKCPAVCRNAKNCQKMNYYPKACRSRPNKKRSLLVVYQVQM